jgi:surface antigen
MGGKSLAAAIGLGLLVAACASGGDRPPAAAAPSSPPAGALDAGERRLAELAILESASAGSPRRWNGARPGYYGLIEPEAAVADGDGQCRDYVHTLFIDGRAQRETGRACRPRGGVWQIRTDGA